VVELIEQQLATHSAAPLDAYPFHNVCASQALLYSACNAIGGDYLSAPVPNGDCPRLTLFPKD